MVVIDRWVRSPAVLQCTSENRMLSMYMWMMKLVHAEQLHEKRREMGCLGRGGQGGETSAKSVAMVRSMNRAPVPPGRWRACNAVLVACCIPPMLMTRDKIRYFYGRVESLV